MMCLTIIVIKNTLDSIGFWHFQGFTIGFDREMMGLIGAGNNPMVGMTVAVAVAIEEACK